MQHYLNTPPLLAFGPTVANDPAKHSYYLHLVSLRHLSVFVTWLAGFLFLKKYFLSIIIIYVTSTHVCGCELLHLHS